MRNTGFLSSMLILIAAYLALLVSGQIAQAGTYTISAHGMSDGVNRKESRTFPKNAG